MGKTCATQEIEIRVILSDAEALAYSQFLKRVGFSDYASNAIDRDETYVMIGAGEKIREALREQGYAPR